MKESVLYEPKNNVIWIAMKDQYDCDKKIQDWFIYTDAGKDRICFRPKSNAQAQKFFNKCIVLEAKRYLDEYRG